MSPQGLIDCLRLPFLLSAAATNLIHGNYFTRKKLFFLFLTYFLWYTTSFNRNRETRNYYNNLEITNLSCTLKEVSRASFIISWRDFETDGGAVVTRGSPRHRNMWRKSRKLSDLLWVKSTCWEIWRAGILVLRKSSVPRRFLIKWGYVISFLKSHVIDIEIWDSIQ